MRIPHWDYSLWDCSACWGGASGKQQLSFIKFRSHFWICSKAILILKTTICSAKQKLYFAESTTVFSRTFYRWQDTNALATPFTICRELVNHFLEKKYLKIPLVYSKYTHFFVFKINATFTPLERCTLYISA